MAVDTAVLHIAPLPAIRARRQYRGCHGAELVGAIQAGMEATSPRAKTPRWPMIASGLRSPTCQSMPSYAVRAEHCTSSSRARLQSVRIGKCNIADLGEVGRKRLSHIKGQLGPYLLLQSLKADDYDVGCNALQHGILERIWTLHVFSLYWRKLIDLLAGVMLRPPST